MKMKTPSWDDLRMLLAVHRDKSFLAAGKTLRVAPSTIARRIEALERTLDRTIVHRTKDGTRLDSDALQLVAFAEELELRFASILRGKRDPEISGTVRMSLPEDFVCPLIPVLARLHAKHPALSVELISESRLADLARGEADIGIRIVRTTSPSVVSKFVGRANTGLFASRDYINQKLPNAKLPRSVAGLHDWIGFDKSLDHLPHQTWLREYGASRFVLRSSSAIAIDQAVLSGMGIGLLGEAHGRLLPGLVQLDLEQTPPHVELFVVFHRDAMKVPRIRTVIKEIELEIRRQLA